MPLPAATGRAIAEYLNLNDHRPPTGQYSCATLLHVISQSALSLVRKVIRQAYARAGLPYTQSHLLRHTMASRLLEGGSSLKEVADVLRHAH